MTLADDLRAADDRVPVVERALLAARLGLAVDDLDLLLNVTVTDLLELPGAVVHTVAAARLLDRLDARVARRHPVDLEHRPGVTVARVPLGDDDVLEVTLEDGAVHVPHGTSPSDRRPLAERFELDDAAALARAVLWLVRFGRGGDGGP